MDWPVSRCGSLAKTPLINNSKCDIYIPGITFPEPFTSVASGVEVVGGRVVGEIRITCRLM